MSIGVLFYLARIHWLIINNHLGFFKEFVACTTELNDITCSIVWSVVC